MQRKKSGHRPAMLVVTGLLCLGISGCAGFNPVQPPAPTPTPTPPPVATASCTVPATTLAHTAASNTNQPTLVFLDPKLYPKALCNDGSPAAYVIRPGVGAAARRWVLMLQGGDYCYDQQSCAARAAYEPNMVSSNPYQGPNFSGISAAGIESADPTQNPDFYDATQIQALYCSSDYWSGTKAGSAAYDPNTVSTWNFQGRAILSAVVSDLERNQGLSRANELLLTGQSAGGVGVFAMVNDVARLLPSSIRFVASADGGFGDTAQDYNPGSSVAPYMATGAPALRSQVAEGIPLWGGHGDSACASATSADTQWTCYEGSTLLAQGGTITLPMLVLESQLDAVQLGMAGVAQAAIDNNSFTAQQSTYMQYFSQQMRSGLDDTNSTVSLFAPDALLHTLTGSDQLFGTAYTFNAGSVSAQTAVKQWYQDPCTPQRNLAQ